MRAQDYDNLTLEEALVELQRHQLPTKPELDNGNVIVAYSLPRRLFERLALLLPNVESIYPKRDERLRK